LRFGVNTLFTEIRQYYDSWKELLNTKKPQGRLSRPCGDSGADGSYILLKNTSVTGCYVLLMLSSGIV